MLRLTLITFAGLTLALAACGSDEESPNPEGLPIFETTTSTPDAFGIIICGEIGVPGEATPSGPAPEPSCDPGDDFTVTPNVRARIAEAPALPSRMTALTRYLEFETDTPSTEITFGMPLTAAVPIGDSLTWFTYESGQWRALAVTAEVRTGSGSDYGMASGDFDSVPANLILLSEP